ncbi:MAG: hypothetical protein ACQ5SW_06155 [Sphaerochaetaceae bacterium]
MKRALIPVLLVLLLTLVFTSCDANIRGNIAEFMDGFSDNVYIESGLVTANTANAAAVANTAAAVGTGDSAQAVSAGNNDETFGVSVTVPAGVTKIIKPQSKEEQEDIKDDLATSFASPTQTKELVETLKSPATDEQKEAAQGTVTLFNDTLDTLKTELAANAELADTIAALALPELDDTEELTQGDVLVLQMMTNLISNTVAILNGAATTSGDLSTVDADALTSDDVLGIVDDALFTAQVAEQLSGAASIDFSGQLDLTSLLESIIDRSQARSTTSIDLDDDVAQYIALLNGDTLDVGLIPDILSMMGVTRSGDAFSYTKPAYKNFLLRQNAYRASIEFALQFARDQGLSLAAVSAAQSFDSSTLIKYVLAVAVTEHHAYWEYKGSPASLRPETIFTTLLDLNPTLGRGNWQVSDGLNIPDGVDFYDSIETFLHDGTVEKPRTVEYYETIIYNLQALNSIKRITQLDELLDKLLADGDNSLQSIYNNLDN